MGKEPRKMNAAEKAEFDARMAGAGPLQRERHGILEGQQAAASATIAMLERRTRTQTAMITLEGGDQIEIFSRLSEADQRRIQDFEDERLEYLRQAERDMNILKDPDPKVDRDTLTANMDRLFDQAADCWLRIIAIVTVDPAISYGWLKQNPDKYSAEDIVDAYLSYREYRKNQIAERAIRVKRAISFRAHEAGESVHAVPALDGDS